MQHLYIYLHSVFKLLVQTFSTFFNYKNVFFILSAQYIIPNLHFKGQLISLFLLLPSQMSASFKHDKHTNTIKQRTYQNQLISLPLSLPPLRALTDKLR